MEGCDHLAKLLFSPAGAKNKSEDMLHPFPSAVMYPQMSLTRTSF